jgi:hypothetical protein
MKLTYPVCCGVDVHKTFLVATIITSNYFTPNSLSSSIDTKCSNYFLKAK